MMYLKGSIPNGLPTCQEPFPLVIVEGFLGGAGPLWGNFEHHCNNDVTVDDESPRRKIIFTTVGPVSSLHDRACELYYALKGGVVDYGEEHSRTHGHSRYGRVHQSGLYLPWSRQHPLHFLGHSIGGATIVKLQWLLCNGFFGASESEHMILSVTAVSSPFRGTQVVYTLGEEVNNSPAVRSFSLGSMLAKGVHVASYLSPYMPAFLDMHADSRSLSCKQASFPSFLRNLWHSDWAESRDAAPFDVTFEAADAREAREEGMPMSGTFYRSYTACMTESSRNACGHYTPSISRLMSIPPLYLLSRLVGSFDFSALRPSPSVLHSPLRKESLHDVGSVLRANDGIVPVFSQWHPFDCSVASCRHQRWEFHDIPSFSASKAEVGQLVPGIWDVYEVDDATHISLVPFWLGTARQCAFWKETGRWLRAIDGQVHLCHRPVDVLA